MDWIEKKQDVPGITDPAAATSTAVISVGAEAVAAPSVEAGAAPTGDTAAKSTAAAASPAAGGGELMLRCTATGKVMTVEQAKVYSARTGHQDFEQTTEVKKPLTEEEKARKKKELEAKRLRARGERGRERER